MCDQLGRGLKELLILVFCFIFLGSPPLIGEELPQLNSYRIGELRSMRLHAKRITLPKLSFRDAANKTVSLEHLRGQVLVLNLWATWCVPCVKEMPALDRLQSRLGRDRILIIPVSQDRGGNKVVPPYFQKLQLRHMKMYFDNSSSVMSGLRAFGLPTSVIIDPNGREVARVVGAINWDSDEVVKLLRALAQKP